jgi:hypothetical protein
MQQKFFIEDWNRKEKKILTKIIKNQKNKNEIENK